MASEEDITKVCKECGETYPATTEYFVKELRNNDGLTSYCKKCRNAKRRAWESPRLEEIKAYKHLRYMEHRETELAKAAERQKTPAAKAKKHEWYLLNQSSQIAKEVERNRQPKHRARAKAWREANAEQIAAKKKADYLANREAIREKQRQAYQETKEARAVAGRIYREKNWDIISARKQAYCKANPEKSQLASARRAARKKSFPSNYTVAQWRIAKDYWHHACAVCSAEEGFWWTLAMDHWVPLSKSLCPGTISTNIVPLCDGRYGCNSSKRGCEATRWLIEKLGKQKAKRKLAEIEEFFAYMAAQFPEEDKAS